MKITLYGLFASIIAATALFTTTSCGTEEPDGGKTEKVQPTFTDLNVSAGDTGTIDFAAYDVWTLSSDRTWFKLDANTGKAGQHKIGYTITTDNQSYNEDYATVRFLMDGKESSFKVTRSPKERSIALYRFNDVTYTWDKTDNLNLKYADLSRAYNVGYKVIANFDWRLTVPSWIKINGDFLSGKANPTADPGDSPDPKDIAWAEVDYTKATLASMVGEFVFSDEEDPTKSFGIPTSCFGVEYFMLSNALRDLQYTIDGKYIDPNGAPQVKYSFNITSMPNQADNGGAYTIYNVAKRGKVYGIEAEDKSINYNVDWCEITPSKSQDGSQFLPSSVLGPLLKRYPLDIHLPLNEGVNRSATIVALPNKIVAEKGITGPKDLVRSIRDSIKLEFQDYVIGDISQAGSIHGLSFARTEPRGVTLVKLQPGDEDYDKLAAAFSVTLVYVLTIDSFEDVNFITLNFDGYTGSSLTPVYSPASAELKGNKGWLKMDTNGGYAMAFQFGDNYTTERFAWVIPKDDDDNLNKFAIKVVQRTKLPAPATR